MNDRQANACTLVISHAIHPLTTIYDTDRIITFAGFRFDRNKLAITSMSQHVLQQVIEHSLHPDRIYLPRRHVKLSKPHLNLKAILLKYRIPCRDMLPQKSVNLKLCRLIAILSTR